MKKILLIFLLMLCVPGVAGAWGLVGMSGGVASESCDTSSVILWWRCEAFDFSGTNGTLDYSANDDTVTANGGLTLSTDAVKYGTNGIDFNAANEYFDLGTPSATLDDEGRIGAWFRITTFANNWIILQLYGDGSNKIQIRFDGTEEISFWWLDNGGSPATLTTTTADLTTATWYWIEAAWKSSTNYREIFVDGVSRGSSAAAFDSFTVAVGSMQMGDTGGASGDIHADNIIISTDSTVDLYTACKDELEWPE